MYKIFLGVLGNQDHGSRVTGLMTLLFSANEKRAFLLYYSLPLLFERVDEQCLSHLAFLVGGVYRLLKDSISQTDLQEAGVFLKLYCAQAPYLYGEYNHFLG